VALVVRGGSDVGGGVWGGGVSVLGGKGRLVGAWTWCTAFPARGRFCWVCWGCAVVVWLRGGGGGVVLVRLFAFAGGVGEAGGE